MKKMMLLMVIALMTVTSMVVMAGCKSAERRTRPGIDEQPTAAEGMGSGIGRPHDKNRIHRSAYQGAERCYYC